MKKVFTTAFAAMALSVAYAEENPTKPGDTKNPLTFSGYLDTYFFLNSNRTKSNLGASGFERIFDQHANSFQLGLAQLKSTYSAGKVTGVLDLVFGNHADLANYGNLLSPLGGNGSALALKQAFVSYQMNEKWSLTAGQFGTNVGYEVIDAPVNFNYSLSNLFGNGPFYHTGVKLQYNPSDRWGLMVGLNNGLDSKDDNNTSKGAMAQLFLSPKEGVSIYLNWFGSNEASDGTQKNYFRVYDLTATFQATEKTLLGLNAASGHNASGGWSGAAFYAQQSLTPNVGVGVRMEYFDNSSGAIYLTKGEGTNDAPIGVSVASSTLTVNWKLGDNLLFKPEVRYDAYSKTPGVSQFTNKNGQGVDAQATYGGAFIFYF